ncbi:MAG TPA: hypothetical protein VD865_07730 [Stenotrophomonas sp.]|nr:hypothetical protein [Stenotrophomonas sp.]
MSDSYPASCVQSADRPSNDELVTLMAGVVRRDKGALEKLHVLVRPLVTAFHEGQVQAGRLHPDELDELVEGTLWTIYRQRLSYDRQHPFRAWLLQVARHALLERFNKPRPATPFGIKAAGVSPASAESVSS